MADIDKMYQKCKFVYYCNILKEKTTQLKDNAKTLTETLNQTQEKLTNLLYNIPNVPHELVQPGKSEDDNEEETAAIMANVSTMMETCTAPPP